MSEIEDDVRDQNSIEKYDAYLESKLLLFANLKEHFDSILDLKATLRDHIFRLQQSNNQDATTLKHSIRDDLIKAGIFNEELIQFLLLISERERSFEDFPNEATEEKICRYYFDKYKFDEKWSPTTFRFYFETLYRFQKGLNLFLEELATRMIAKSRASLEQTFKTVPEPIAHLIKETDIYFQQAFFSFFAEQSPLSLIDVTHITKEFTEHADKISGKTFIDIANYNNREKFIHLIIHEAMHLCFPGFAQTKVEEALIEYFIERMLTNYPPHNFSYTPVSETYQERKECLKAILQTLPDLEKHFIRFFLTWDDSSLKNFLKNEFSDEIKRQIESEYYIRGMGTFIKDIEEIAR